MQVADKNLALSVAHVQKSMQEYFQRQLQIIKCGITSTSM